MRASSNQLCANDCWTNAAIGHSPARDGASVTTGPGADGAGLPDRVSMENITKCFGATRANVDVCFDLEPGEAHALLGENGAGKSTLMSILFGLLTPDEGRIVLGGEPVQFRSPADALRRGIGMVHQHFMLVPTLTVAENVAIGTRHGRRPTFPRRYVEAGVADVAASFGLDLDPCAIVADLSVEDKQRVEIVRLLYRGARTIILDEPTAALGSAQVKQLLGTLQTLRAAGRSIVIVTHKLDEVMHIADRATVLKAGRVTVSSRRAEFTKQTLAAAMFDEIPEARPRARKVDLSASPRLQIEGLVVSATYGRHALRGLDLRVAPGEIVGVAGVADNGQTELADAIAGMIHIDGGAIKLDGADISDRQPLERREFGISIIPEDRHQAGLVLDMTVAENLALSMVPAGRISRHGLLLRQALREHARELAEVFDIRPPDPDRRVLQLSGGNQQKVVVARELARSPQLLVASSPTRGLDLSAAMAIHRHIEEAASRGCAVLVVSPDLDEILTLADRIVVLFKGRIVYEIARAEASIEALGLAMTGHVPDAEPAADGMGAAR